VTPSSKKTAATARTERGFALLLVIWVLALLAVLAAGVAADSSSEAVIARNRMESAQARALADSGVTLGILGILDPNPATRWRADGRSQQFRFADGSLTVALQDEGGKIDINAAPTELIGGLADEFGLVPDQRAALLEGIADRRSAFKAASAPPPARLYLGGDTYTADLAGRPFADLSELRLLPGITRATYDRLLPYLTVYSESATLNPVTASRDALLAVPGISPQEVDFYLGTRNQAAAGIEKPALSGADRYVQVGALHAVTITTKGVTPAGASFTREAVVMISPNLPIRPYRILSWRQPREPAPAAVAAAQ
jgi:general secretion pathway protein K